MEQDNSNGADRPLALTVDWELYARYLDASDLSDEEKRAFVETIWSLVVTFVDLGFRLNPVQQACGEMALRTAGECPGLVSCDQGETLAMDEQQAIPALGGMERRI